MDLLIHYPLTDTVEFAGVGYTVNASFDTILRVFDMLDDDKMPDYLKIKCGLIMFLGNAEARGLDLNLEEQGELFREILGQYVQIEQEEQYDILGNLMEGPMVQSEIYYDIKHDASAIYASFMQAYGIDLIEQQGKLHWLKFKALLSGLPENTQFKRIVSIRQWKPSDEKKTRTKAMKEAQKALRLPSSSLLDDEDEEEQEY